MEDIKEDEETIKKHPTLGKIIIEMKVRNILNYLSNCLTSCLSKKKKNTDSDNTND